MTKTKAALVTILNDHTCLREEVCQSECNACLADHLLANGVTIGHEPFCKAPLDKLCLAQENALGTDRALLGEVIRMVEELEVTP